MTDVQKALYTSTVRRLESIGAKDPTSQIIALAEEVEHYRDKIKSLEDALTREKMKAEAQYLRRLETPRDPAIRWSVNLGGLISGVFGDPYDPKTMLVYWKAQEAAGYPYASENVKYFEELVQKSKEDTNT